MLNNSIGNLQSFYIINSNNYNNYNEDFISYFSFTFFELFHFLSS